MMWNKWLATAKSNMSTCDTCKWWGSVNAMYSGYANCTNAKLDADYNDYPVDGLVGGEPADCTIVKTGPKFGCIHHEPKDNPQPQQIAAQWEEAKIQGGIT